jgi:membrane-bound lytic murein transglycosylase B
MLTPAAAPDPTSVAADLETAESGIRSPATRIIFMPYLARLQQDAYRQLVAHPDWVPAVLAQVTPNIRQVIQANLTADLEIRALNGNMGGLPHWRIVDPPPADQLLTYYREAQRQFGVSWEYLAAIHLIETRMSRVQGTSVAGAQGPMQFMPATWAAYGRGNINDPHDSILAAARYLHANGAPGNMANAIYHYNPSWRYVRAVTLYAQQMIANERAFMGYYYWQVYVPTTRGDVLLPTGYSG